jgi:cytidylate kinase
VARALADRVGAIFRDTGLLYRAVTLQAQRHGIRPDEAGPLADLTKRLQLDVLSASVADGRPSDVLIAGEDVTTLLREPSVDRDVSAISAHAGVREALLPLQRRIADGGKVVMVGRDIATVVVPDAGVKIYLDASLDERARRRHLELIAKGRSVEPVTVRDDLARRDAYDASRDVSPLSMAPDARVVRTDGLEIDEVIERLEAIVRAAWREMGVA